MTRAILSSMLMKQAPEVEDQIGVRLATGPACKQIPHLLES
jgi:hypothetical protein